MSDSPQLPSFTPVAALALGAEAFLLEPPSLSHAVQFYEDDAFLCEIVARFVSTGLTLGEGVVLIVTPAHAKSILARLEPQLLASAREGGQLNVLDARTVLESFLVDGLPDPRRFFDALDAAVSDTWCPPGMQGQPGTLRAFGEMVDVLWRDGNPEAALRLEGLWNEARELRGVSLLCAYGLSNFREHRDADGFRDVCHVHTHVLPADGFAELSGSEARLREISALQQRACALQSEIEQRKAVEASLREVLEHRMRVEAELRSSLEREQDAREQAQASDAFKDVFVGLLGHDLRNPLNTILTTARLMTLREELSAESQRRIDRVISSGVRMQRMIDQILDLARDRLTSGISVSRTGSRDLVPLVGKIVEEARQAHPAQRIELKVEGPCVASVDADRFEQVLANLLGNAATHGDPARPIQVRMSEVSMSEVGMSEVDMSEVGTAEIGAFEDRAGGQSPGRHRQVRIAVRNHGRPIDPAFLPLLFDPFRRSAKPEGQSDGLGLGLYISERIVRAHGGQMRVESSAAEGTSFEVTFPCEGR